MTAERLRLRDWCGWRIARAERREAVLESHAGHDVHDPDVWVQVEKPE